MSMHFSALSLLCCASYCLFLSVDGCCSGDAVVFQHQDITPLSSSPQSPSSPLLFLLFLTLLFWLQLNNVCTFFALVSFTSPSLGFLCCSNMHEHWFVPIVHVFMLLHWGQGFVFIFRLLHYICIYTHMRARPHAQACEANRSFSTWDLLLKLSGHFSSFLSFLSVPQCLKWIEPCRFIDLHAWIKLWWLSVRDVLMAKEEDWVQQKLIYPGYKTGGEKMECQQL